MDSSPEQFHPVGVWQSLREDGKARRRCTGKVARKETTATHSQSLAARLHERRGSAVAETAAKPISVFLPVVRLRPNHRPERGHFPRPIKRCR